MPCPHDAAGSGHACALSWICGGKNHMEKKNLIHNILRKKLQIKILNQLNIKKIKSTRIILKKIIKKTKGKKKNKARKHCSNL